MRGFFAGLPAGAGGGRFLLLLVLGVLPADWPRDMLAASTALRRSSVTEKKNNKPKTIGIERKNPSTNLLWLLPRAPLQSPK
jgi:hypothetical protein